MAKALREDPEIDAEVAAKHESKTKKPINVAVKAAGLFDAIAKAAATQK